MREARARKPVDESKGHDTPVRAKYLARCAHSRSTAKRTMPAGVVFAGIEFTARTMFVWSHSPAIHAIGPWPAAPTGMLHVATLRLRYDGGRR